VKDVLKKVVFVVAIESLFAFAAHAAIYKWTDAEGNIHCSDGRPPAGKVTNVTEQPTPSYVTPTQPQIPTPEEDFASESVERPPPALNPFVPGLSVLPESEKSACLETTHAGWHFNAPQRRVRYMLTFKIKRGVPYGAVFDVQFANPQDLGKPFEETFRRAGGSSEINIESPFFSGLRCGNYLVEISIYRNSMRKELLGVHKQYVQSRIDMNKALSREQFIDAMLKGNCAQ